VSSNRQIFPINSLLYSSVIIVVNQLERLDSFVQPHVLLTVHKVNIDVHQFESSIKSYKTTTYTLRISNKYGSVTALKQ
jgi:ASC-1-like (ASCH) protein